MSLNTVGKFALGFGFLAQFYAAQGIHILAVPYYQMTLGVDPFLLGLAMTLPLLLAGVLGPVAGHVSDNMHSRWGRRRPFIAGSALALCFSYGLVWMVPQHWSSFAQISYFTVTASCFYLAGVVYSVSLRSFTYELAGGYHQRTSLMGFTAYFLKAGSLTYQWAFPLAQLAFFGGVLAGIKFVGWGIGIGVFALLGLLPALLVREAAGPRHLMDAHLPFLQSMGAVFEDRNMRILMAIILIQMGGAACVAMMDYYLLVYYVNGGDIQQGSVWKGVLSTAYAVGGMAYVPVVTHLSYRVGKVQALRLILGLNAVGGLAKWFIYVPGAEWLLLLDAALCSAVWTAMVVLVPSMIADRSSAAAGQHSKTGVYASVQSWVIILASVIVFLGSGLCLNLIGFESQLAGNQPEDTLFAMRVILSAGTVGFSVLGLLALARYSSHRNVELQV
ncbi:MFS transporter [Cellvibrio polysaccharolyticus]|uniref:MFS transporter n=1 Tax=Cellvibrio polysaccharolyticus TaxID=2082724 RepID=A0A928V8M5_9GAMM|nr:MFS transporter [Cellvibrio polysaccharolyticus]MBE8718509.1 MFS transporter [Cellvibrio polysaccharolyticus]